MSDNPLPLLMGEGLSAREPQAIGLARKGEGRALPVGASRRTSLPGGLRRLIDPTLIRRLRRHLLPTGEGFRSAPILLAALALGGCATTPLPAPAGFDASATTFIGYVQLSDGEFRLFESERDLVGRSLTCVSAALPRNLQRSAADLNGAKVSFTGRAVAWADRDAATAYNWQGSHIRNTCGRDVVILAETVEVLR